MAAPATVSSEFLSVNTTGVLPWEGWIKMLTYKARRPAIKPWSRAIILGGVSQDGEKT